MPAWHARKPILLLSSVYFFQKSFQIDRQLINEPGVVTQESIRINLKSPINI